MDRTAFYSRFGYERAYKDVKGTIGPSQSLTHTRYGLFFVLFGLFSGLVIIYN